MNLMEFVLHQDIFNTPFHFKCSTVTRTFEKVETIEDGILVVNDTPEFNTICSLYDYQLPSFPSEKYKKPFEYIGTRKNKIQWHLTLPTKVYKQEVVGFINNVIDFLSSVDLSYYYDIYNPTESLFGTIQRAKINSKKIFAYLADQSDKQDKSHLKTMLPYGDYAEVAQYTRLDTRTGRLTHPAGPRILNLQKKYRDVVESRFEEDGDIWYFDYSSLEPRVLLSMHGKKDIPQDIYTNVISELNITAPRAAIKTTILSRLYGAGENSIVYQLKDLVEYPESIIEIVDDYFQINELKAKLNDEYIASGHKRIFNYYGKPIHCPDVDPYKLINYFIQSTAVDVAMLGFNELIRRIALANLLDWIVPVFVIHDAIVLDIHKDYNYLIPRICKAGSINIKKFEKTNFFLNAERAV